MLLITETGRGDEDEPHVAWQRILPRMWMIAIGAAFFALFDTLALSLLPLYAMRQGDGGRSCAAVGNSGAGR
jgi:hypothetical protein